MAHPGAELSVLSRMTPRRDRHDPHGVLAEHAGPGRTVRLERMETFLSYAGLLEGRPVVEMNADVIAGLVEQYRRDGQDPQVVCDAVVSKLAPFSGTITADAEYRFNALYASGRVIESGCNAHGRRKFRDAEATQPGLAAEGGAFIGAIYGEEERAQRAGLVGEALLAHRQQRIKPIVADFEKWLAAVEPALLPSEPLAVAVRYYSNHRDALFRFVVDPAAPIDNSATEREFQNVAKLRLNMLFAAAPRVPTAPASCSASSPPAAPSASPSRPTWSGPSSASGTHRNVFVLPLDDLTPAAFKRAGPLR